MKIRIPDRCPNNIKTKIKKIYSLRLKLHKLNPPIPIEDTDFLELTSQAVSISIEIIKWCKRRNHFTDRLTIKDINIFIILNMRKTLTPKIVKFSN